MARSLPPSGRSNKLMPPPPSSVSPPTPNRTAAGATAPCTAPARWMVSSAPARVTPMRRATSTAVTPLVARLEHAVVDGDGHGTAVDVAVGGPEGARRALDQGGEAVALGDQRSRG